MRKLTEISENDKLINAINDGRIYDYSKYIFQYNDENDYRNRMNKIDFNLFEQKLKSNLYQTYLNVKYRLDDVKLDYDLKKTIVDVTVELDDGIHKIVLENILLDLTQLLYDLDTYSFIEDVVHKYTDKILDEVISRGI